MTAQTRVDIAGLIPHAEPMVLLDSITEWKADHIVCTARSHLDRDNPLRENGFLSIFAGLEYAAQAMAAHTRLTGGQAVGGTPRKGMIVVASDLKARVDTLDATAATLVIRTNILARNADSALSRFVISAADQNLLEGRMIAAMADAGTS